MAWFRGCRWERIVKHRSVNPLIAPIYSLDAADTTQGIFFQPASGPDVRVTDYAPIKPQSLTVLVPAGLSGALTVRVASYVYGSVCSYSYSTPITT